MCLCHDTGAFCFKAAFTDLLDDAKKGLKIFSSGENDTIIM